MKTLDGAFKKIYGEELAKYGFQKIKGRQPYFVRLIGDEIVQVITYVNDYCLQEGYKEFTIYGGVATVYRQELRLNESPRNNNWINTNRQIYLRTNPDTYDEKFLKETSSFLYEKQNETSLEQAVKYSLEITKQIMIPEFDKITDLNTCMDYFYKLHQKNILYDFNKEIADNYDNEGLLNVRTFTLETFIEKKDIQYQIYINELEQLMESGKIPYNIEWLKKEEEESYERMQTQIEIFKKIVTNPDILESVEQKLERRKIENTKRLREYGFDV